MIPAAGFLPPAGRGASSRRLCGPAERRPDPEPPPRGAGDREGRPRWGTGGSPRLQLAPGLSPPVRRAEGSRSAVAAALGAAGRGGNLSKKNPAFGGEAGAGSLLCPRCTGAPGCSAPPPAASEAACGWEVALGDGTEPGRCRRRSVPGSREREGKLPLFGKP